MFYMVNPSKAPKKKKKKKRARRNPELLIVNPYEGNKKTRRKKMARKKSKKRRKNRKNPVRRRKNPLETIQKFVTGKTEGQSNVVRALIAGAGGGAAMAFGAAVAGKKLGETSVGAALVGAGGGLLGAGILGFLGKQFKQPALAQAAPLVAAGAISLSVWELVRDPIVEQIGKVRDAVTGGGVAGWENEFDGLGQSYWDEFQVKGGAQGSTVNGLNLGEALKLDDEANPFLQGLAGLSGYEPLGDIYGNQRLGSFEAEPGYGGMGMFGAFEPEEANVMHQQIADRGKHDAGLMGYGAYGDHVDPWAGGGAGGQPFISD